MPSEPKKNNITISSQPESQYSDIFVRRFARLAFGLISYNDEIKKKNSSYRCSETANFVGLTDTTLKKMLGTDSKGVVFVQTECSTQEDLEERETNFTRRNTGKDPLPAV